MTRGVPAHSACARGWSDTVPMAASSTLFCLCSLGISANFFAVAHAHRHTRQRVVRVSAFRVRRPVWSSRPSGRNSVRGRTRHPVQAVALAGMYEFPVGVERAFVRRLPLVAILHFEGINRLPRPQRGSNFNVNRPESGSVLDVIQQPERPSPSQQAGTHAISRRAAPQPRTIRCLGTILRISRRAWSMKGLRTRVEEFRGEMTIE